MRDHIWGNRSSGKSEQSRWLLSQTLKPVRSLRIFIYVWHWCLLSLFTSDFGAGGAKSPNSDSRPRKNALRVKSSVCFVPQSRWRKLIAHKDYVDGHLSRLRKSYGDYKEMGKLEATCIQWDFWVCSGSSTSTQPGNYNLETANCLWRVWPVFSKSSCSSTHSLPLLASHWWIHPKV